MQVNYRGYAGSVLTSLSSQVLVCFFVQLVDHKSELRLITDWSQVRNLPSPPPIQEEQQLLCCLRIIDIKLI